MPHVVKTKEGTFKRSFVWLGQDHKIRLDAEIWRRRSLGLDVNKEGVRINLNRSVIIRDLIEQHLKLPERFQLGQGD